MPDAEDQLQMTRRFDASPERVFEAWTDPKIAAAWLFTSLTSEAHHTQLDVRVGGKWEITDRRDGVDYRAVGEYLEVAAPSRLVFSFGMPQFSAAFTTVTVEIAADGNGAVMTLTQAGLDPAHVEATRKGWDDMFDELALRLGQGWRRLEEEFEEHLVID
jgi:uncharacterized protein YndB with AHSA1/START domain